MDEVTRLRLNTEISNLNVKPLEILYKIIDDIERGVTRADSILCYVIDSSEDSWNYDTYRANLTRSMELTMLEFGKLRLMKRWTEG